MSTEAIPTQLALGFNRAHPAPKAFCARASMCLSYSGETAARNAQARVGFRRVPCPAHFIWALSSLAAKKWDPILCGACHQYCLGPISNPPVMQCNAMRGQQYALPTVCASNSMHERADQVPTRWHRCSTARHGTPHIATPRHATPSQASPFHHTKRCATTRFTKHRKGNHQTTKQHQEPVRTQRNHGIAPCCCPATASTSLATKLCS